MQSFFSHVLLVLIITALVALVEAVPPPFIGSLSRRGLNEIITSNPRQVQCPVYSCADAGRSCGTVQTPTSYLLTDCNGDNVCNITSSSQSNSTGSCISKPRAGQSCAGTRGECSNGYVCDSVTLTCVADSNAVSGPGTVCTKDSQCNFMQADGNLTHSCVAGKCKFVPDLGQCQISNLQCNVMTSFCNSSDHLCHPTLATGAVCDLSLADSGCQESCLPLTTSGTTGNCRAHKSAVESQPCRFDQDCNEGLSCAPAKANTFGVCQRIVSTSTLYKTCATNNDCTAANNEYCGCNSVYGSTPVCLVDVLPAGYTVAYKNYDNCAASACKLSNGEFDPACVLSKCLSEICKLVNVTSTVSDVFTRDCYIQNTLTPMCINLGATSAPTVPARTPGGSISTTAPGGQNATLAPAANSTNSPRNATSSPDPYSPDALIRSSDASLDLPSLVVFTGVVALAFAF